MSTHRELQISDSNRACCWEAGLVHDHSGNLVLEQKVIANFAAKDRGEGEVAEENSLTLKRDSSINRYP